MNRQRATTSPSFQFKIARLQQNFRQAYMSQGEPLGYCNTLIKSINSKQFDNDEEEYKFKMYSFADEINLIKMGESFPQNLKKLILEREELIRQLRSELIGNRNTKQMNLSAASQKLENVRMYSLMIIEKVSICKKKLKVGESSYFFEILQKLGQDVDFLRLSALRKFIEFSNHNDPLFMVPYKRFWSLEVVTDCHRRPIIDLFTLDAEYHKRIEAADKFLRNIEKSTVDHQQFYNQINTREIIEKKIEQSDQKVSETREYNTTLQKFTLPSLRNRLKTEEPYANEQKTKQIVSNLIKEVISQYKTHGRQKSNNNQSYEKSKKRVLSRSIERSRQPLLDKRQAAQKIDTKPNNIRYRIGKTASLKSNEHQKHYFQERPQFKIYQQQYQSRPARPIKRLPEIDNPGRQEYSSEKLSDYERLLHNQESEMPSNKQINLKSLHANEIQLKKYKQVPGKIRFNQLNPHAISKMQTQPSERYEISNRFQRMNNNRMSYSNKNSMKNSALIDYSPAAGQLPVIVQEQRQSATPHHFRPQSTSSPQLFSPEKIIRENRQNIDASPSLLIKSQESQTNRTARSCWISQQFSYNQVISKFSTEPQCMQTSLRTSEVSHTAYKSLAAQRLNQSRQNHSMRINFQFNQQIYSPPYHPVQNIKLEVNKQEIESSRHSPQPVLDENRQLIKQNASPQAIQITPEKVTSSPKETLVAPFSIRGTNKSQQKYEIKRIEQDYEAQNSMSQRTSQNKSEILQENPKRNENINLSQIKQFLQQSQDNELKKSANAAVQVYTIPNKEIFKKNQLVMTEPEINRSNQNVNSINGIDQTKSIKTAQQQTNTPFQREMPKIDIKAVQDKPQSSIPPRESDSSSLSFHPPLKDTQILPNYSQNELSLTNNKKSIEGSNNSSKVALNDINIRTSNFTPVLDAGTPQIKIAKEESKSNQKAVDNEKIVQMLQKCSFQSKQIKQQDLLQLLKKTSPSNFQALKAYISQNYLTYRQLLITNCLFDNEICCYCLYYPQISPNARTVFIIHLEIIKPKFIPLQMALLNTFIKYIFINDPCENIVYLKHSDFVKGQVVKQLKNFQKEIQTPMKMVGVDPISFLLVRKGTKCVKQEELTSVLSFINMFASSKLNSDLLPSKDSKFTYEMGYLKKIERKLKKDMKKFVTGSQLDAYLKEEELPKFKTSKFTGQIYFTNYLLEECLIKSKFFVCSKEFYFTIQYPYTCLYEGKTSFFLALATGVNGKYFIFGDKLYEEEIDISQSYKSQIENRDFDNVFKNPKFTGKLVTCPTFRKEVESALPDTTSLVTVELNWKDYLKGVRYVEEQNIYLELACPFFFGFAEINENKKIQLLCSTIIEESNTFK